MVAVAAIASVLVTLLAGCVGGVEGGDGSGNGSGSGSGSGQDASIDAPKLMWVDAAMGGGNGLPCENPATPPGDGHHFPGQNCFQACHNHGFTLAGTLYTNATGNTAFPGATISVTDSNNKQVKVVTRQNGNFYTTEALQFPVLVMASSCPSAVRMPAAVAMNGRACNSCHAGGTNNQMHLP
jgi:hypothetical protein